MFKRIGIVLWWTGLIFFISGTGTALIGFPKIMWDNYQNRPAYEKCLQEAQNDKLHPENHYCHEGNDPFQILLVVPVSTIFTCFFFSLSFIFSGHFWRPAKIES